MTIPDDWLDLMEEAGYYEQHVNAEAVVAPRARPSTTKPWRPA
jgi:hypothetical protein